MCVGLSQNQKFIVKRSQNKKFQNSTAFCEIFSYTGGTVHSTENHKSQNNNNSTTSTTMLMKKGVSPRHAANNSLCQSVSAHYIPSRVCNPTRHDTTQHNTTRRKIISELRPDLVPIISNFGCPTVLYSRTTEPEQRKVVTSLFNTAKNTIYRNQTLNKKNSHNTFIDPL
jgi:hypothetical protein